MGDFPKEQRDGEWVGPREYWETPKGQADHALTILDSMADKWSEEINLPDVVGNAVSPMRLNRNAPKAVRDAFTDRMKKQITAIARQAFIEGAYRAITGVQDERAEMKRQGIPLPCTCGRG